MVGRTCKVGELASGKLDWANLHWAKDRRPVLKTGIFTKISKKKWQLMGLLTLAFSSWHILPYQK